MEEQGSITPGDREALYCMYMMEKENKFFRFYGTLMCLKYHFTHNI
jgi:hypothetical protein